MNLHCHRPARTVLITGASGTIGRALSVRFAKGGWKIGIHWHGRSDEAQATAHAVKARGADASLHQADICDPHQVERMIRHVVESWGTLDVLVCNAATASGQLLIKMSADDWERIISTNLTGTFHCMQAAAPYMLEQRGGAMILIGSYAAFQGAEGQAAYAASKAGLLGLARSAAREWGPHRIRVNVLLPGRHASQLTDEITGDPTLFQDHLLQRAPRLRTVAAAVFRLACSPDTSGQVWNVDSRIL